MRLPKDLEEKDFLKIVDSINNQIAGTFPFGSYTLDDIKQEAYLFAVEALEKFDPIKGNPSKKRDNVKDRLFNFLRQHIRNRLINLKRDNFERNEPPYKLCPFCNPSVDLKCVECGSEIDQDKWESWKMKSESKKNLATAMEFNQDRAEPHRFDPLENYEIHKVINDHLPLDLRTDYLRLMDGVNVCAARKEKVQDFVALILRSGVYGEDWRP